jgi:hypothetical protein
VNTIAMVYNPLDNLRLQQIDKDDHVVVTGKINDDLFGQREIYADSIVSLSPDQKKNKETQSSN